MRPTGQLHLGHLVGALQNWVALQEQYDCFYFVADWHALTSDYADTSQVTQYAYDNVADWIAAGLDPERSTFFVQSMVPEHAELYLLLSMVDAGAVARARADLQGAAGSAEGQGSVVDRVSRLSAAADRRRRDVRRAISCRSATIRWRTSSWRARSSGGSTGFYGNVLVEAAAAADESSRLARPRRRQEDEQEPREHDSPVRGRRRA